MDVPLLSVCLITYNHVRYIRQAIESVLMQEVDFTWELIIADDCSTDGTREILQEYQWKYPGFIKLILQERNVGPGRNWLDLITSPKSKYIAYLEGDDYWTDTLKLKKQFRFLEQNMQYTMVHSMCIGLDRSGAFFELRDQKRWNQVLSNLDFRSAIFRPIAFSSTIVFRNVIKIGKRSLLKLKAGDWALFVLLTLSGNAYCMRESTCVYRTNIGVSHNADWVRNYLQNTRFLISVISIRKYDFIKNMFLMRGALYFCLLYVSNVMFGNLRLLRNLCIRAAIYCDFSPMSQTLGSTK